MGVNAMSPKTLRAALLVQILSAGSVLGVTTVVSTPAAATAVAGADQAKVDALAVQISQAVRTVEVSAVCQNAVDAKAKQACEAAITAAIEGVIAQSGASPLVAEAALTQAQAQLAQQGALTADAGGAIAVVSKIVLAQIGATGALGGIGGVSGPGTQSALGGPPSGGGGGGGSDYRPTGN